MANQIIGMLMVRESAAGGPFDNSYNLVLSGNGNMIDKCALQRGPSNLVHA